MRLKINLCFFFLSFIGLITTSSCGVRTVFKIQVHWPYCGGKLPNASEKDGTLAAFPNHSFVFIQENRSREIRTDATGVWRGRVRQGRPYTLRDADKTYSFNELKAMYSLGDQKDSNYRYLSESEWLQWKNNYDFESTNATTGKNIEIIINRACFVGFNPIITYVGPSPK